MPVQSANTKLIIKFMTRLFVLLHTAVLAQERENIPAPTANTPVFQPILFLKKPDLHQAVPAQVLRGAEAAHGAAALALPGAGDALEAVVLAAAGNCFYKLLLT